MKNKVIILSAFTLFVGLTSCKKDNASDLFSEEERQEQASNIVDPDNAPTIVFRETSFDFGDVKPDEKVEHYFVFENTGKAPLVIKNAKASCGCTVPKKPEQPIPAGGKDSILVSYTGVKSPGKQQKTVTLTTNTVKGTELVTISANIVGDGSVPVSPGFPTSTAIEAKPGTSTQPGHEGHNHD